MLIVLMSGSDWLGYTETCDRSSGDLLQRPPQDKADLSVHVLTYLSRVSSPGHVLGPDGFFDMVYFLLVAFAVPHGRLLGRSQGSFESFHPLGCGPQTLLQFGQLTAQVRVVPHQLWTQRVKRSL